MTTYTLPDGATVTVLERQGDNHHIAIDTRRAWVRHPVLGVISVTEDQLTETKGAEPPNGSIRSNGIDAWIRLDDMEGYDPEGRWWCTGVDEFQRWAGVPADAKAFVEDPATNAPDLPWELDSDVTRANVRVTGERVSVWCGDAVNHYPEELTPSEAEQFALAVFRAAREARG